MWWLYFLATRRRASIGEARSAFEVTAAHHSFIWGYGHYFVFASAAAVGAGSPPWSTPSPITAVSTRGATMATGGAAALFLVSVWVLHHRQHPAAHVSDIAYPVAAVAVVGLAAAGAPLWVLGLVMVGLVVVTTVGRFAVATIEDSRLVSRAPPVESDKRYEPVS